MPCERHKGSVLVLTLVILLLLGLITMATVSSVNISSHIFRNHESVLAVDRDADNLINYMMTNKDYFLNYSDYINENRKFEITIPDYVVGPPRRSRVVEFECTDCVPANTNSSAELKLSALDQTRWLLRVEVSDLQTGAGTAVVQDLLLTTLSADKTAEKTPAGGQASESSRLRLQSIWWYSQALAVNRK